MGHNQASVRPWQQPGKLPKRANKSEAGGFADAIRDTGLSVVDSVDRQLLGPIIIGLGAVHRARPRIDERRELLGFLVGETSRAEIRHRVANDAGECVDARRSGAVVPRIWSPQRSW